MEYCFFDYKPIVDNKYQVDDIVLITDCQEDIYIGKSDNYLSMPFVCPFCEKIMKKVNFKVHITYVLDEEKVNL